MYDDRAVDASEADAVQGLVSAVIGKRLSTYKPPNKNMNMIRNLSLKGFCSLYNKGIGMIRMAKSDTTLNEAMMVTPRSVLMQWWGLPTTQFESMGIHWKIAATAWTML